MILNKYNNNNNNRWVFLELLVSAKKKSAKQFASNMNASDYLASYCKVASI